MASRQPESKLTNDILKNLKGRFGGFWVKIHGGPYQRAGLPDIVGCIQGRYVGLEVKVPGKEKTLTDIQRATLDEISRAGGIATMVTSVEEAVNVITELFDEISLEEYLR